MTGEELEKLLRDISGEIEQLKDDPEKPLDRVQRKHRVVLQARLQALERIKGAREKGEERVETNADLDYTLLTEYGEKHPLWLNFVRSQVGWWSRW